MPPEPGRARPTPSPAPAHEAGAQDARPRSGAGNEPPEARGLDRDEVRLLVADERGLAAAHALPRPAAATCAPATCWWSTPRPRCRRRSTAAARDGGRQVDRARRDRAGRRPMGGRAAAAGAEPPARCATARARRAGRARRRRDADAAAAYPDAAARRRAAGCGGPPSTTAPCRPAPRHGRPIALRLRRRPVAARRVPDRLRAANRAAPRCRAPAGRSRAGWSRELVSAGREVAPVLLHTGVSSLEAGEPPLPERFRVPARTAELRQRAPARRAAGSSRSAPR